MKRNVAGMLLVAGVLTALCAGCAPQTEAPPQPAPEAPEWQVVSTEAGDFGIAYDDLEDLSGYPLDKLAAYCLGSDGIYAEQGFDQLYHRFLEAPNTCVSYFALIQDKEEQDALCGQLTAAAASWYAENGAFSTILTQLEQTDRTAGEKAVVDCLRTSYEEALKEN